MPYRLDTPALWALGAGLLTLYVIGLVALTLVHRARRNRPNAAEAAAPGPQEQPADWTKRRAAILLNTALVMVSAAMASAMYFSGWAMWRTVDHKFGLDGQVHLILPIFGLFDLLNIAFALLAAYNMIVRRERGVPYALLWVFVILSGLMSASDGDNTTERFMRFMAPVAAAVAFEVLLAAKAHSLAGTKSALARAWMWFKARRGWTSAMDVDQATAARRATAGKLANLRHAITLAPADTRRHSRAKKRFMRELRTANERQGFANDPAAVAMFRTALASLYGALAGTAEAAVGDASPWTAGRPELHRPPATGHTAPADRPAVEPAAPAAGRRPVTTPNGHRPDLRPVATDPGRAAAANGHQLRPVVSANGNGPTATRRQPDGDPTATRPARRSSAETRAAYERLVEERPGLSKEEYAALLGIASKTLRTALANTRSSAGTER